MTKYVIKHKTKRNKKENYPLNIIVQTKTNKMNILNRSAIMKIAWKNFRANKFETFAESLKNSWLQAKKVISFADFYEQNYKKIVNLIYSKTQNIGLAEELTNDIFLKFSKIYKTYDYSKNSHMAYINKCANNGIIDYYRSSQNKMNKASNYISDYEYMSDNNTFDIIDNNNNSDTETYNNIVELFNMFSDTKKQIATMYFIDGTKYKDIAYILDIPIGTVKNYIAKIREKLQTKITENNLI